VEGARRKERKDVKKKKEERESREGGNRLVQKREDVLRRFNRPPNTTGSSL